MKTKFRIHLLLLFVAGALLAGCSKDSTTPENGKDDNNPTVQVSKDNSLTNFSFKKDKNTSLESNCSSTVNGDLIYITVPDGVSLATLVPSFNVHEKATVKAGTNAIQSGSSTVDFSKAVTITVTAENGSSRSYTVLAKNGNQQVDAKIYSFMIKHNIPGVSVALSKDEEIVYTAAYGYADKETKERVTSDHMFRLASMSKQHTAIGIMKLVEQGHLKLTDTVFGKRGYCTMHMATIWVPTGKQSQLNSSFHIQAVSLQRDSLVPAVHSAARTLMKGLQPSSQKVK